MTWTTFFFAKCQTIFSCNSCKTFLFDKCLTNLRQLCGTLTYKTNPPRREFCHTAILGSQFFKQQNLNTMPETRGKAAKKDTTMEEEKPNTTTNTNNSAGGVPTAVANVPPESKVSC